VPFGQLSPALTSPFSVNLTVDGARPRCRAIRIISEASVYRVLKARDLIASPAFIVIKAADAFKDKTTVPNQLWQTDFTYLKVISWAHFTYQPCLTTSRAPLWPGSSAPA
jgi:hypothetical protein